MSSSAKGLQEQGAAGHGEGDGDRPKCYVVVNNLQSGGNIGTHCHVGRSIYATPWTKSAPLRAFLPAQLCGRFDQGELIPHQ
jgi:hypothetical protein